MVGGVVRGVFGAGFLLSAGSVPDWPFFAAGVLPAFAGVVPVEAKLRKVRADAVDRLLGEGDPDPVANDFGEFVLARHPAFEYGENFFNWQGAIAFAFLEVDVRARRLRRVES